MYYPDSFSGISGRRRSRRSTLGNVPLRILLFVSCAFCLGFLPFAGDLWANDDSDDTNTRVADELEAIRQAIQEKGANWTAGETWLTRLTQEERRRLFGARGVRGVPTERGLAKRVAWPQVEDLPAKFDWRDNGGNWMTPVRDQTPYGTCWAFAMIGAMEAWLKIRGGNPRVSIDLSEQCLISADAEGIDGWHLLQTVGVCSEACFPYRGVAIPLDSACVDWQSEAQTVPGWGFVCFSEANVEAIKRALLRKPLIAAFDIYADLDYYVGGVYEHVYGEYLGPHAVVFVGWQDEQRCWIFKNSLGTGWGEGGYGRIRWNDCGIGLFTQCIWDACLEGASLGIAPDHLDLSVTNNQSVVERFTIHNPGAGVSEYTINDFDRTGSFHVDGSIAYDGLSWWCGDPDVGIYGDGLVEYLDTPAMDLSTTDHPRLGCMGYWEIEMPSGVRAWDGWNIWVSQDGGETFAVADPIKPLYNCREFGLLPDRPFDAFDLTWKTGTTIPSWAGKSHGWQEVEVDLTPYRGEQVVLRFLFISDLNTKGRGLFLDDIMVADGERILFEDHGEDATQMKPGGEISSPCDWITAHTYGTIAGGTSAAVEIQIDTEGLEPGDYQGGIFLSCNDAALSSSEYISGYRIPIDLHVSAWTDYWPVRPYAGPTVRGYPALLTVRAFAQKPDAPAPQVVVDLTPIGGEASALMVDDGTQGDTIAGDGVYSLEVMIPGQMSTGKQEFTIMMIDQWDHRIPTLLPLWVYPQDEWIYQEGVGSGWKVEGTKATSDPQATDYVHNGSLSHAVTLQRGGMIRYLFEDAEGFPTFGYSHLEFYFHPGTASIRRLVLITPMGSKTLQSLDFERREWQQVQIEVTGDAEASGISLSGSAEGTFYIDDMRWVGQRIEIPTAVAEVSEEIAVPSGYALSQNYPNPFNAQTVIPFDLPSPGKVKLCVYNIAGQKVRTLVSGVKEPGRHFAIWNGRDERGRGVASGIYLYRLEAEDFVAAQKALMLQ